MFYYLAMTKKYQTEDSHDKFDEYITLARTMWRYSLSEK